jgi:hypothetical protein
MEALAQKSDLVSISCSDRDFPLRSCLQTEPPVSCPMNVEGKATGGKFVCSFIYTFSCHGTIYTGIPWTLLFTQIYLYRAMAAFDGLTVCG